MLRTSMRFGGAFAAMVVCCLGGAVLGAEPDELRSGPLWMACGNAGVECPETLTPGEVSSRSDAAAFFHKVVQRYRALEAYKDTTRLVQVTQRDGRESNRVETRIACEVAGGRLNVQTPASQLRNGLGLNLPVKPSEPVQDAQLRYDLWLAPHMALKFTQEPLEELRAGVDEGFTPVGMETVTIDERSMVHLHLRSGDGLSDNCTAKFDLFVNADSMLIERIEGQQRLPDGASFSTSLHIDPDDAAEPDAEPAA